MLGSCHGIDIPFAFHNLDQPGVAMFLGGSAGQVETADAFSSSILAFARTGNPGWERYCPDARTTMQFGVESAPIDDPEPDLRQIWDAVQ